MNNKKFMSLLLSLVMLITTFTTPVQAISSENINNKNSEVVDKLKGNVIGDEEVFEFDSSFIPTVDETISVEEGTLSIDGQEDNLDISGNTFIPQRAPQSSYNTEVNVKVNGINGSFDWSILPNGFTVKFEYQTADKTWHELSQNPTLTFKENNLQLTTTVPWPQNGTVKKGRVTTSFNDNFVTRVVATRPTSQGVSGIVKFDITLYEIPNTIVQVKYLDIYGKDLASTDLPTATSKELKTRFGLFTEITKTLPAKSTEFNLRTDEDTKSSFEETDFNTVETLGFKIDGKTSGDFTVGQKKYKYTIEQKTKKDPTVVTIVYDADVAVPPMKDDGKTPVDPQTTGYTRITFDPTDKAQNPTKTYYDVKSTLTWAQATATTITPHVAEPGKPTPNDDKKSFIAWKDNGGKGQKLSEKTGSEKVAETTFTAVFEKDVIGPVDPGVTPNPDKNLYWTVTFKSADTATGTVAKENTVYVLKTANKTLADVTAPKTTPATGYAFEKWTPALDNKTKVDKDIEVTGTFTKDVIGPVDPGVTPNPDKNLYWTVTFKSADTATGTVAKENTVYVLKTANKTLADVTAPKTTPATGYAFEKWTPALDNKTKVDKDIEVTGTFTKDVIGPVDPGVTPNPDKNLYWTVTFKSADTATGTVAKENTVYVLKTANKTLADVTAPKTTPATGYAFEKWTPALDNKTKVDKDIEVTGTFTKDVIGPVDPGVTPNPDKNLYWTVTFKSADTATGTVAKENTVYVLKTANKTLADVTAPKTTPATGYAFEKWTPALDNKTKVDKDIEVTGTFTKDVIGPVDPGVTPNPDKNLYWTVTFKSADTATGTVAKENTVYVLKTANKTLADVTAPKTTPATGYAFEKWTPALDNKTKVDKDIEVTGTFTKDVIGPVDPGVTPNPDKNLYWTVTFKSADTATGTVAKENTVYVLKTANKTLADVTAPKTTPATGYAFEKWTPALDNKTKVDKDIEVTGTFTKDVIGPVDPGVTPNPDKNLYWTVTFKSADTATGTVAKENTVYVLKTANKTLADVTAPKTTPATGYAFEKWTPALDNKTKVDKDIEVTGTFTKDVIGPVDPGVTPNPDKNLYWTVTFKSADTATGTVAKENTVYVLKTANKTLADVTAPKTTPATGYAFEKWTPALDNKTKVDKDIEVTGTFTKDVIGPVDPGVTPNPDKNLYWTVTFKSADTATGTVAKENTVYVLKTANKTLADVTAPKTTPATGYAFEKWTPALDNKTKVDKDIEVTGTFTKDVIGPVDPGVTPNPDKNLYWTVTFKSADTATGTVAKENTVYVLKTANKTLADVTAPKTTPATGYAFEKWTPALDNKTKVDKDIEVTGTFTKDVIGPVDPGVTPNPDKNLYWTVTFKSADTATGTVAKENTVYVLKTANKTLADVTAPKTTPATGYAFEKWTPALDNKTKVDKDIEVTGTFTKDVIGPVDPGVTPNPDKNLYWTVTFKSADTATGTVAKENTVYVLKTANKTLADVTAPKTTPATGYAFEKWTPALDNKTKVDKDIEVTGTFTKDVIGPVDPGVTPNPDKNLYWTVTFKSADTATGTVAKENTVYVLKTANKTLADVTAPKTTPATGYAFEKWTPALDNKTKVDKDIEVTGTFTKDVIGPVDPGVTPNPDKNLYWTVTFKSADTATGTVAKENTVYVLKTANKTLADVTAPKTTPATGYAFEKWTPALDNKTKVDKDIEVTGTFTKDVIGPVDPGVTPNPDKNLYWTVTFKSADTATGTVAKENTVYVLKTANKTLADVTAPKTTPATGYAFEKWTPALDNKTKVDKDIEVTGTFTKDVIGPVDPGVTPNPDKNLYWTVTFKSADTATGTVAKENTVYVLKTANKTLADVTAPKTTPATGYAFEKWTPALDNKTKVDKDIEVTGTFTKDVIGPVDPGVTPNPDKNLYWTVTFKSADTATGTVAKENTVYVLKTANKTLADVTAPKTTPATGYAFEKWTPALDNKTKVDKDIEVTGTFTKDVIGPVDPGVTPNPDKNLYWTVTFKSADTATGTVAKENTVYVLKTANKTLADVTAPKTTPATGYAFEKWTPALDNKTKVDKDIEVTGTFTKDVIGPVDPGVTPNPDKNLYWTVTFKSADTATGTVAKENTVYVLKTANKTLADVTAPKTTPATGYAFEKWTPALDNKTKVDKDIEVTGTFTKDVIGPVDPGVTPNPDKNLYWTVTFKSADTATGTVAKENTVYVLKTANKTLADVTAPKTTPATGYAFEKWTPALDNKTKVDKDIEVTGTFTKDVIGPVDPGVTPNPDKNLYWTVTFKSADTATGTVAKENTVYVLKTANKTLADVTAPKTTPATGYAFEKWTPALDNKTKVDKDIEVTGTFTKLNTSTKPAAPTVDDITEGDNSIKVKTPTDGDTVIVKIPDPTNPNNTKDIEVKKNPNNEWTVDGSKIKEENGKLIIPVKPEDITKDKEIKVTVKDSTKATDNVSDPTIKKVKGKGTPTPTFNYTTLTLDENYRGGRISDHDVYEGDLIERYLYTPRRRGYVFEGWSYDSKRLDEVKPGDRIYYPTTLYAIWSKDRYYGRRKDRYNRDKGDEEPVDTREVHDHNAYMFGYTDGTVRPNGKITRAEAAALVTRLLGLDTFASAAKPMFSDTPSSWYNKAINAAVDRGIMKGYPDGRFRPNAPITRAEFTQMISTIDNKPYGVAPFADVKGHWAERPIGSEYQAGRIMGYPDVTFRPNAFITRCEAVVILNKIFERNFDAMSLKDAKNAYLIKGFIDLPTSFWGYYDMIEATNSHSFKRRVEGKVQEDWTLVK